MWRLLLVTMPLTILGIAVLGWWVAGLAPGVALLLGAVLAPTDPVLASDVQVGEPLTDDIDDPDDENRPEEDDDIRFSLTAEAGLNDGLAFPFVHLALLLLAGGFTLVDAGSWVGWYVVGKIVLGVAIGMVAGWLLGRQAFYARSDNLRLADTGEPLLALAALLASYGAAELVGGYGFLAVFACAMRLRSSASGHSYQRAMHGVVERLERLMTLMVLLVLGMAMTRGLLEHLDWRGIVVALALVLVVRPVAGYAAVRLFCREEAARGRPRSWRDGRRRVLRRPWRRLALLPGLRHQPRGGARGGMAVVHRGLHHHRVGAAARGDRDTRDVAPGRAAGTDLLAGMSRPVGGADTVGPWPPSSSPVRQASSAVASSLLCSTPGTTSAP